MKSVSKLGIALALVGLSLTFGTSRASAASDRDYNIRISPVPLLVGYLNIDFDIQVNEEWTVGPTFSYWGTRLTLSGGSSSTEYDLSATSIGARANWYPDGVFADGWYLSPMVQYTTARIESRSSSVNVKGEAGGISLTGLGGYHWFWDNFNLSLGGGLVFSGAAGSVRGTSSDGTTTVETRTSPGAGIAFDFMLGLTF